MIPGFHLIDRDFVLRSDSCGHNPKANLFTDLLPTLRKLKSEPRQAVAETPRDNPYLTN
jgi:hypothetical protein